MCEVKIHLHYFACGYSVVPAPFAEKTILSPLNDLGILLKIQLTTDAMFSFQNSQFCRTCWGEANTHNLTFVLQELNLFPDLIV